MFMHPLCVRALRDEYGPGSNWPDEITGDVLQVDELCLDHVQFLQRMLCLGGLTCISGVTPSGDKKEISISLPSSFDITCYVLWDWDARSSIKQVVNFCRTKAEGKKPSSAPQWAAAKERKGQDQPLSTVSPYLTDSLCGFIVLTRSIAARSRKVAFKTHSGADFHYGRFRSSLIFCALFGTWWPVLFSTPEFGRFPTSEWRGGARHIVSLSDSVVIFLISLFAVLLACHHAHGASETSGQQEGPSTQQKENHLDGNGPTAIVQVVKWRRVWETLSQSVLSVCMLCRICVFVHHSKFVAMNSYHTLFKSFGRMDGCC